MKGKKIRQIIFCALAIALSTVLSFIKVFQLPTGGTVTLLSMLVICLPGYFFGIGAGIKSGIIYGILQLIIDPFLLSPLQVIMDYFLASAAFGLSGLFSNSENGLMKGYIVAVMGRYIFAVLSGWIFFGTYVWEGWNSLPYSIVYNVSYIFTDAVITIIIISLPPMKSASEKLKSKINKTPPV